VSGEDACRFGLARDSVFCFCGSGIAEVAREMRGVGCAGGVGDANASLSVKDIGSIAVTTESRRCVLIIASGGCPSLALSS